jgi:hypothetical protein
MPQQWKDSIIVPIHKKGDKTDFNNYRGISLLSSAKKFFFGILLARLTPHINDIRDESKKCLNSGNAFYHSAQNLLSSRLISKLKIIINKTVILPIVLYVCETWSLTLREEHRLRVFENRMLRRIFGPKRDEEGS